jgi:hypothetical protein
MEQETKTDKSLEEIDSIISTNSQGLQRFFPVSLTCPHCQNRNPATKILLSPNHILVSKLRRNCFFVMIAMTLVGIGIQLAEYQNTEENKKEAEKWSIFRPMTLFVMSCFGLILYYSRNSDNAKYHDVFHYCCHCYAKLGHSSGLEEWNKGRKFWF